MYFDMCNAVTKTWLKSMSALKLWKLFLVFMEEKKKIVFN